MHPKVLYIALNHPLQVFCYAAHTGWLSLCSIVIWLLWEFWIIAVIIFLCSATLNFTTFIIRLKFNFPTRCVFPIFQHPSACYAPSDTFGLDRLFGTLGMFKGSQQEKFNRVLWSLKPVEEWIEWYNCFFFDTFCSAASKNFECLVGIGLPLRCSSWTSLHMSWYP